MNKRSVLLGACLLFGAATVSAQKRVTGRVLDAEGQPVAGATVRVEGSKTHTKTDADGRFTLADLPANARQLSISYLGMKTQHVSVSGNLNIVMQDDQEFDEAIVVAYGTSKKSHFTGVATVVGAETIDKVQVSNPLNALAGRVSGAQINTASGQPGATSPTIRVLGITSVMAGKDPLIVVDGSPFDGNMNDINPQDIENISLLKDASSTSLYGARGANGVIMITTKKGKVGFSSITFDAKVGSNSRAVPDYKYVKSPAKYYEMYYQSLRNYFRNIQGLDDLAAHAQANANLINGSMGLGYLVYDVPNGQDLIGLNGKLNPAATLGYHTGDYTVLPDDWADAAYRSSVRQEYNLTATGATDVSNFYASFNYLNNEGITAASGYERITGRLKADYQLREWLKVGGNFSYSHSNTNLLSTTADGDITSSGNVFALNKIGAIYPLYVRDAAGHVIVHEASGISLYDFGDGKYLPFSRPMLGKANPLATNRLERNNTNANMLNAVGEAEIKFLKDFRFQTINSVYLNEGRGTYTTNPYFGQNASQNGSVTKSHARTYTTNFQQTLNWMHTYGGAHSFNVTVGHEYYNQRDYMLWALKINQFDPSNDELAGAVVDGKNSGSYRTRYNTEGWFGFFRYNYAEKYFVSATYRRDASSKFHKDHRWGNFGSFGAGWLINKEDFFNIDAFDELKFRFSYGTNGNDGIDPYLYTNTYSIVNAGGNPAATPVTMGNKDITWETVGNFTTGFDFSLFDHRLYGSVDYFIRKTSDMLFRFPLTPSFGYTSYYANIGDMRNMGFLLELNGDIVRTDDFLLSARVNMTAYKNKIVKLPEERRTVVVDGVEGYSSSDYFYGQGEAMYTYMLKTYVGVDQHTGEALYATGANVAKKDGYGRFLDAQGNTFIGIDGKQATDINKLTDSQRDQLVYDGTTANYSEAENHLHGTALAPVYGGFGVSAEWKGFDFNIDFQYQIGGQVYDDDYRLAMGATRGLAFHADLQKAWTKENPSATIPRLQYNDSYMVSTSSRWLTNASYLSLNNVSLGYSLPAHLLKNAKISKLRIYVTADNVWLWSKRQGMDPRQSISGSTTSAFYAPIRTVSGGIQVSF